MFLGDLIQRTLGEAATIAPRRPSRFEPTAEPSELVTTELAGEPPAGRRETIPPAPATSQDAPAPERIETRIVERVVAPPRDTADRPKILTPQSSEQPIPVTAAPTIEARNEPPPEHREPVTAPAPSPARPVSTPEAEPSRQTIIREKVETHFETRTIERRLESLVRESKVERVEEFHTLTVSPAREALHPPVLPRSESPRIIIVPQTKQALVARPLLMEAPEPTPAPVVQVTIGRVEVRATTPAAIKPAARNREPKLDLEGYLQRRERA
jgi:hypothetical protein